MFYMQPAGVNFREYFRITETSQIYCSFSIVLCSCGLLFSIVIYCFRNFVNRYTRKLPNFTTATYFRLTLPCFVTLLFLTSSQTKVNTLFFYLSIWNTTNRNTYRHKSFQFKLKAYIIIANRTINRMNMLLIPYLERTGLTIRLHSQVLYPLP